MENTIIIPTPKKATLLSDDTARLSPSLCTKQTAWEEQIAVFKSYFYRKHEFELQNGDSIELVYDAAVCEKGYTLDCSDRMIISASSKEGILYGIATALQLLQAEEDGTLTAPQIHIEDWPDKEYRGLMVSLAGGFHTLEQLKKTLDVCFFFKVKYAQLHFIDNTLYTLPSKVLPDISTKEKCYTFEEIAELNRYAKERGIVIVPEFETPGHAASMIRAYPEIFANHIEGEGVSIVAENGNILDDGTIICAGSPKAFEAVTSLLTEIAEMFPDSPYIHIGGDEATIAAWNQCSTCLEYMREHGIEDEYELYSEFVGRVAQHVFDIGRTPIVWEGFPKKGVQYIPQKTIVIAWESHYHLVQDLLEEGFEVINCTWQPLYIVNSTIQRWTPKDIMAWNVYNWQHWWPNSEACLNPITVAPTDQVMGAQLCSWCYSYAQEIFLIIENLAAMSERVWNVRRVCDDKTFLKKHTKQVANILRIID